MNAKSFFALLTGAAAGLTLGFLLAPETGEETRKKVKRAAEKGYDAMKDATDEFFDKATDVVDDVEGSAAAAYTVAKDNAEYLYKKAKVKAARALKDLSSLKDTLAEQGENLKEDARKKIVDQLTKLEDALSKDDVVDDEINVESADDQINQEEV